MDVGFLSLLPPVIVLVLGYLSKRVIFSLACGVCVAAFIAKNYDIVSTSEFVAVQLWNVLELPLLFDRDRFWDSWNIFICIFLFVLGIFITLIHHCGGAHAYETFIRKKLSSSKQVEASSLLLSKCLCIDDYFSSLTVGSVMHPVSDTYRIARAKLAFLVDSMAAPMTVLCPVSSWVAAIVGFLKENGVTSEVQAGTQVVGSPFVAYLQMIPYIFYSFVVAIGSWYIVLKSISFGLMKVHETHAKKTGNVFNGNAPGKRSIAKDCRQTKTPNPAALSDFFVPLAILTLSIIGGILHSGHYFDPSREVPLVLALRDASAAQGLFVGGNIALSLVLLFFLARKKLKVADLPRISLHGCQLMINACLVLILAWTLGGILKNNLMTGQFLANLLIGHVPNQLVPVMFFIASLVTSFAIGSAWGTAAIMFPIGIQLVLTMADMGTPAALSDLIFLAPTLGAVLSGSVAGDHISPISDTTIMTSTSTAMDHSDHVKTQMTYVIPLVGVTSLCFLVAGYTIHLGGFVALGLCFLLALGSISLILSLAHSISKRRDRAS